jgi:hypothetical protein
MELAKKHLAAPRQALRQVKATDALEPALSCEYVGVAGQHSGNKACLSLLAI